VPRDPTHRPDFKAFGRKGGNVNCFRNGNAAVVAPARQGFLASIERRVDPDLVLPLRERKVRAQHALNAHMGGLSQLAKAKRYSLHQARLREERLSSESGPETPQVLRGQHSRRYYGISADQGWLVEAEAEIIREGARRALAGETLDDICRDYNRRKVPTGSGGLWTPDLLSDILKSDAVAGLRRRHGTLEVADWPAILPPDVCRRLRERLSSTKRYLLTGLVIADEGGAVLFGRRHEGHGGARRYVCGRGSGPGRGSAGISIVADDIEHLVGARVVERICLKGGAGLRLLLGGRADPGPGKVGTEPSRVRETNQILGCYAHDLMTEVETRAALRKVDKAKSLEDEIDTRWLASPDAARREVLEQMIVRITIKEGKRGSHRFDPERVVIHWRDRSAETVTPDGSPASG
jgi:hypothetical protein